MALQIAATTYQQKELSLLHGMESTMDWHKYPVQLSPAETETINSDRLKEMLQNKYLSPYAIAKVDITTADQSVREIQQEFDKAMLNYIKLLEKAIDSDVNNIKRLTENTLTGWIIEGVSRLIYPLSGIASVALGWNIVLDIVHREGSAHRRAWFVTVNALEDVRIEQLRKSIILRSETLEIVLEENRIKTNQYKWQDMEELRQLSKIYIHLFSKPLIRNPKILEAMEKR